MYRYLCLFLSFYRYLIFQLQSAFAKGSQVGDMVKETCIHWNKKDVLTQRVAFGLRLLTYQTFY